MGRCLKCSNLKLFFVFSKMLMILLLFNAYDTVVVHKHLRKYSSFFIGVIDLMKTVAFDLFVFAFFGPK